MTETYLNSECNFKFEPNLNEFNGSDSNPIFPWEQLIVLCDTSGSTINDYDNNFNVHRRGIHHHSDQLMIIRNSGHLDDIENEVTINHKPIIYIQEEGIAHILSNLANNFNMTNVKFILAGFDNECNLAKDVNLTISYELFLYANTLDSLIVKNFTTTNLSNALNKTIYDFTKNTLLILASDGRYNNIPNILNKINYNIEQFKSNNKHIDIFTFRSKNTIPVDKTYFCDKIANKQINFTDDHIKCVLTKNYFNDIDDLFLRYLAEKSMTTYGYSIAYGDYKLLNDSFESFINIKVKNN